MTARAPRNPISVADRRARLAAALVGSALLAGQVELLRGTCPVGVGISRTGKGRDAVQDAVAVARQVIAFFRLPTGHAKPYPTPATS